MTDEKKQPEKEEEVKKPRHIVFNVAPGEYGMTGSKL